MSLIAKDIVLGSAVVEFASKLYEETYDRRMRIPLKELESVYKQHKADYVALYDDDLFVGFYYVYKYENTALIYYLAVTDSMRGRGYGTEILDLIKERYYPKYRIALSIEAPRVDDKLVSSRYRNLAFYSRNGFIDTLYKYESVGIQYEVLYWGEQWDPEEIHKILRSFRRCCGYKR